jgi:hypothetical protein
MASKKKSPGTNKPTPTPEQKARKAAASEVTKRNRQNSRTKSGSNVPKSNVKVVANSKNIELVNQARLAQELAADDERELEGLQDQSEREESRGALNKELLKVDNDYGQTVDETPEEERLPQGLAGREGSGLFNKSESEIQSAIDQPAFDKDDDPVPVLSRRRLSTSAEEKLKAERESAGRVSRSRRKQAAIESVTPTYGPPNVRDVTTPDEGLSTQMFDKDGVRIFDESGGRPTPQIGRVIRPRGAGNLSVSRKNYGQSMPLSQEDLETSNQFFGFKKRQTDTPAKTIFVRDADDRSKLRAVKGTLPTVAKVATGASLDAQIARDKREIENDVRLAQDVMTVSQGVPQGVKTGETVIQGGTSSVVPEVRELTRPGTAADIDPGSTSAVALRRLAANAATGYGEMGRASQKGPAYGSTLPQTGQKKQTTDTGSEFDRNLDFYRRTISGGQFFPTEEFEQFIDRSSSLTEKFPKEWSPSASGPALPESTERNPVQSPKTYPLTTAEGVPLEPILGEGETRAIGEEMTSTGDKRKRSIPIITSSSEIFEDEEVPEGPQKLIGLLSDKGYLNEDNVGKIVDLANNPKSGFRTVQTAPAAPYSASPEADALKAMEGVEGPVSPTNMRRTLKFIRHDRNRKADGTTTGQALDLLGGREGQLKNISEQMEDFLGKGGGESSGGAVVGSEGGKVLSNAVSGKGRSTRSVKVKGSKVNQNTDVGLARATTSAFRGTSGIPGPGRPELEAVQQTEQSFPTGAPNYTNEELGVLYKTDPKFATIMDPASDAMVPRVGSAGDSGEVNWDTPRVPVDTRSRVTGTNYRGAPATASVDVQKTGGNQLVPPRPGSANRAGLFDGGEVRVDTDGPEGGYVNQPIDSSGLAPGTMFIGRKLGGQFGKIPSSRIVQPGTPGVQLDPNSNPVITDPEAFSRTPVARRALNEGARVAGIDMAKRVSASLRDVSLRSRPDQAAAMREREGAERQVGERMPAPLREAAKTQTLSEVGDFLNSQPAPVFGDIESKLSWTETKPTATQRETAEAATRGRLSRPVTPAMVAEDPEGYKTFPTNSRSASFANR